MPKTLSARFRLAWMLSSVPGMMPKRGAMTPARAVWTIESQTTAQPLVAQRRRLGVRGPERRSVERAIDVARDGGRFLEREIAARVNTLGGTPQIHMVA